MATEVRAFTLNIPAGTTASSPIILDVSFPPRRVDAVEVVVPPGPSGLVGWCVMNSLTRVIPYQSDQWIVTAGETISWPLEQQIDSGSWQVAGYNTGVNVHAVYFRFLLSQITSGPASSSRQTIDESLINAASPLAANSG